MPRKPRPDPFTEGSVPYIWKYFLAPLIQYKHHEMTTQTFLEDVVFDIKNREIVKYRAKQDFIIPGLYYAAPHMKLQGLGYRHVNKDALLFVRFDAKSPDSVDVEFQGGQGNKDQCFFLEKIQWYRIVPMLEEMAEAD